MTGKCWGAEELSVEERHYKIIMAGVDQFGGNNEAAPLLRAFELGVERLGKEAIDTRYRQSAHRILRNIFRTGLMENPYLDAELTRKTVGCPAFVAKGKEAQRKSVVLLKNKNALLPLAKGTKVYIPDKVKKASFDWFGQLQPEKRFSPIQKETAARYFSVADTPQEADVAIVFMDSPISQGYRDGYKPISLQYRPYTANLARDKSIAGDDRGYRGVSNTTDNENELDILLQTKEAMGTKPVVACLSAVNPVVVSEFEPLVDAFIVDFSVEKELLLELVSGMYEPSALLPFQMPKDMRTVETQYEDVPFDMTPYTDELGSVYDYTFGLNWSGQINDERTKMFKRKTAQ
jgi:beta-glucosidase